MSRIWTWFKETFLTKKFIIFGIIGIINTIIHNGIYFSYCLIIGQENANFYLGTAISFTIATICSYFMNSKYTFKEEKFRWSSFIKMFVVFAIKLFLTLVIQYGFEELFLVLFRKSDFAMYAAIPAQLIMIPISFLILDRLFSKQENTIIKM